jgi:hypothetical protein
MNIHHLELFYFVAKHGGIAAAVRNIPYGIQQLAVSGQLAKLEESLGTKLFQRRPFALSPAGMELFGFIKPFFDNVEIVGEKLRRTVRRNSALPRRQSCCTTISRSCCRSFELSFPSFAFICMKQRAPKPRDYFWPEMSIWPLRSSRKNRALGFKFDRYSSCR